VDIQNLTQEQATEIYWQEWLVAKADKLPWPLSLAYFDSCVNAGNHQAALLLQRIVGAADDGIIGPATIKAAVGACAEKGANAVATDFCTAKEAFYRLLCKKNPDFNEFKNGWLNRVSDLRKTITNIC
jgi:lysozyme family protein